MDEAHLTSQEVNHLVLSILEAVESVEEGTEVRASWASEMRAWIELLYERLEEGGAGTE